MGLHNLIALKYSCTVYPILLVNISHKYKKKERERESADEGIHAKWLCNKDDGNSAEGKHSR